MLRYRLVTIGLVISGFLAAASAASAVTLGNTTMPSGATAGSCSSTALYWQSATDSSYNYFVPAGGGDITSWSTNTTGDPAGGSLTMTVLQPSGSSVTVIAADTETLPNPLPAGGVATFNLSPPFHVAAGEVIGLWSLPTGWNCAFTGGTIPAAEQVSAASVATTPTAGAQYTAVLTGGPNVLLNLSANLVQSEDLALSGAAAPAAIPAGGGSVYAFTVANGGQGNGPITFTDSLPAGLKVLAAAAGSGSCTTIGQAVTCTITGLAAGSTTPVLIVVGAPTPGTYPDTATVAAALADPTPADNSATATLTVAPAVVATLPSCKTINLAGARLSLAKAAIPALNCAVGKTTKKASKNIPKGDVISTTPGAGKTLANGTKVNIVVSSGPPKKNKKKK